VYDSAFFRLSKMATITDMQDSDSNPVSTPPSSQSSPNQPPQFLSRPNNLSDDDDEEEDRSEATPIPPKGGYDSRVQQILYESPELEIVITDAGKSADGGYIVYKIRTGVRTSDGRL
jgi:hypothetical protein